MSDELSDDLPAEVTARLTTEPDIRQPSGQDIGPTETPARGQHGGTDA
ncbi:hypothetical protein HMPREF9058_0287 [Actinomyces sp. oral taxon 175 str. F0384]|nr:hypothetical protein HMPREF9058_0287 [Actinomyces sp. oral taxon 175 str. F0384]